jgi:hypothetical protein
MLITLFPRASETYSSLPLFGPVMDDFANWLERQGYTYGSRRQILWIVTWMDGYLRRRRIKRLQDLTPSALQGCWKALHRQLPPSAGAIHVMEQFLTLRGLLKPSPGRISSPTEIQVRKYSEYLRDVRGFSRSTIHSHLRVAADLLTHLGFDSQPDRLAGLEASDLESFDLQLTKPYQVRLLGKGWKERFCPLWSQTAQLLCDFCKERELDMHSQTSVFLNHRDEPLTRFGVRYLLRKYLDLAKEQAPGLETILKLYMATTHCG